MYFRIIRFIISYFYCITFYFKIYKKKYIKKIYKKKYIYYKMIKDNILFIHCPKNGGTYIQNIILEKYYYFDWFKNLQNNNNIEIFNTVLGEILRIISSIIVLLISYFSI